MGELLDKIMERSQTGRGLPKWFRKDNLFILVLLGVLLFIIVLPVKEDTSLAQDPSESAGTETSAGGFPETEEKIPASAQAAGTDSTLEYTAYLEQKLKKMLEAVKGLQNVEVMITLKSSGEKVVEKDMSADRSNTEEQDSAGGTRTVNTSNTEYRTIYQEETQGAPFVVKTISPEVEGVLIVAEGAEKGNMAGEITQIVQALFGVEAHRIKVMEK